MSRFKRRNDNKILHINDKRGKNNSDVKKVSLQDLKVKVARDDGLVRETSL